MTLKIKYNKKTGSATLPITLLLSLSICPPFSPSLPPCLRLVKFSDCMPVLWRSSDQGQFHYNLYISTLKQRTEVKDYNTNARFGINTERVLPVTPQNHKRLTEDDFIILDEQPKVPPPLFTSYLFYEKYLADQRRPEQALSK